jgi:hypothetical protein
MQILLKLPQYTIILLLALSIILFSSEIYAQNGLRIYEDINGGGSTTESSNSNDNTFIYVAGGLIVAGILVYALVLKKDKKAESDTTASINSRLIYTDNHGFHSINETLSELEESIPLDLFMAVKNSSSFLNDKTYLVGLRLKL